MLKWIPALLLLAACSAREPRPTTPTLDFAAAVSSDSFAPVATCNGLSGGEVRGGFFRDDRRPVSVEKLYGEQRIGARNVVQKPVGARVVVAATPGMTTPWLERVAQCHLDMYRATSLEASDEPLSVRGATFRVTSVNGGYAIEIRSDDRDDAAVIFDRAQAAVRR